jgi:SAM-dependent methyltransferase
MLRAIAQGAAEQGRAIEAVGLDINPRVIDYARRGLAGGRRRPEVNLARNPIHWVLGDVRALPFRSGSFDLVICSCFLHHLESEAAAELLHSAASLTRGTLIVSDLVRSSLGSAGFHAWARLMRLHTVTRHDGAISLRTAYRPPELEEIAAAAGLRHPEIHRHRFCRMTLVSRPGVA